MEAATVRQAKRKCCEATALSSDYRESSMFECGAAKEFALNRQARVVGENRTSGGNQIAPERTYDMHTVKSVGGMSVAKILGVVHGCLGLMVAPFFLLMGLIPAATNQQQNNPFTGFFGVGMAIVAPFFYAV